MNWESVLHVIRHVGALFLNLCEIAVKTERHRAGCGKVYLSVFTRIYRAAWENSSDRGGNGDLLAQWK